MANKNNEEIDLGKVFEKIRGLYHDFLIFMYGLFRFVVKSWIILLVLILAGVIFGFIKDSNPEKGRETTLIVQINGDAALNVYDAVEQLDAKLKEKDTVLLKKLGFYKNEVKHLASIEIEPIVNVLDVIDQTTENNRNLEVLVEQAQYEDELLTSEVFVPEYKMHKIKLKTSYWANQSHIDLLLTYLNDNKFLDNSREIIKENLRFRIEENFHSIKYMDSILNLYGTPVNIMKPSALDNVTIVDINITNIHMLFQEKALLMDQNQELQLQLAKYDKTVELINKPFLSIKQTITDRKIIIYPILLVFLFVLFSMGRYYFKKARRLSEEHSNVEK